MKHQLKSILIVLVSLIASALFITMMIFGIKLMIEGFLLVQQLEQICVSCGKGI